MADTMIEFTIERPKLIVWPEPPRANRRLRVDHSSTRWKLISVNCTGSNELVSRSTALGDVNAVRDHPIVREKQRATVGKQ